jgi:hypothetical protein
MTLQQLMLINAADKLWLKFILFFGQKFRTYIWCFDTNCLIILGDNIGSQFNRLSENFRVA